MIGQHGQIWLCLTMTMWLAAPVYASKPLWTNHLSEFAASSPRQTQALLEKGHQDVNQALAVRAQRLKEYQRVVAERDEAAKSVRRLKERNQKSAQLETALQNALNLDEIVSMKRADLAGAESDLATKGARLLELYDQALLDKRSEVERFQRQNTQRRRSLQTYRRLSEQRDRVRVALRPVLNRPSTLPNKKLPALEVRSDDDIETLLDKADLARDLEERFLRQAEAVRKRILEMEAERSLARDVIGLIQNESLFDESDRRLVMESRNLGAAPSAKGLWSNFSIGGSTSEASADMSAPASNSNSREEASEVASGSADEGAMDLDSSPAVGDDSASVPPVESAQGNGNQMGSNDNPATTIPTPSSIMGTTELISGATSMVSETQLTELMMSGALSLAELKQLEKQLQAQAKQMKKRNQAIQNQIEKQSRR